MKIRVNVQGRRHQFGQGVSIAPSQILADTLILFRLELEGRGQMVPTTLLFPLPPGFQTYLRPWCAYTKYYLDTQQF